MSPSASSQGDLFGGAAAHLEPSVVREAPEGEAFVELASALPRTLRMGTSSWAFPGWAGLVYDRGAASGALSRRGLDPYSRHPLLRCVGVDRSFYGPLPTSQFEEYAALVPADFRFVVKADRALTTPRFADPAKRDGYQPQTYRANPHFLDPNRALDTVVGPVAAGLGDKLGVLLFQFPPMHLRSAGGPHGFAGALRRFLDGLPQGLPYAVELRNRELLRPNVVKAIRDSGATLVAAVHPTLPSVAEQLQSLAETGEDQPLVVRWMLGHRQRYEEAKQRYAPFDKLVDPDLASRRAIAKACIEAAARRRHVFVVVNNKAEGSSPLSIIALAREIERQGSVQ